MAMELRALFLLPLCFPGLQGQAPEALRLREGDTLYIQCPYAEGTLDYQTKYWCLLKDGKCQELVNTYSKQFSQDRRIKIDDDARTKTFSVTMVALKAEDSGTYFCAIYKSYYDYSRLRTISLIVFRELLQWELDTLTVQCPAGSGAWCRGQADCTALVSRQRSSKQSEIKSQRDRVTMQYHAQGPLVTMKNLQIQDSGVYWCAPGDSRHTQKMEVVLSVFRRTQKLTAKESGTVSVQCHYKIADYSTASKAWCKREEGKTCSVLATTRSESPAANSTAREGVRIQDDTQQGIVTVTMEQLQVQDSGVFWCALQDGSGLLRMEEVTLSVSKALPRGGFPDSGSQSQDDLLGDSCSGNTFLVLSVVLLLLLLLALLICIALGVRYYRLLLRTGVREAEDTSDRAEGTAQPGSPGRRESSQDDSKGPAYINLDVQSPPSPEDPLYCNVELSQAPRNPQHVEYAIIAFNPPPRAGRE
ncbi:natural cytotoxicity triggering receptor 2 [Haemorhous mexicanus]|uniref:natural cytotoxicity triggering receptor 2 n=1 Tax=Haemorhous mexicanus TaxID=30427 RepID=UPI0028BEF283|nr:natural cytotoxicity triggering receptor 2 [Haemorhous mexicanus]